MDDIYSWNEYKWVKNNVRVKVIIDEVELVMLILWIR